MAARGQHNYSTWVWIGAGLVHLAFFGIWQGHRIPTSYNQDELAFHQPGTEAEAAVSSVALVELPSDPGLPPGPSLTAIVGASDQAGSDPQSALQNFSDAPGATTGQRAPGVGGDESFADRSDPDTRSASTWNTPGPTLMPRVGEVAPGASSTESLARSPKPAYSDQDKRIRRATSGDSKAVAGLVGSEGQGGAPGSSGEEWLSADPRFDTAPGKRREFVSGAVESHRESARMDLGATSVEEAKDGPAAASSHSPDRSNRKSASPFHLGRATTGSGEGTGARGKAGKSNANQGGSGSAAQSGRGSGSALASTRASRSHPYFNEMYRRIDRELRFPKKLALALEQGDLVLSFHLDKKGRIRSLKVSKGSGFAAFDSEALRAFRAAAPFGPIPQSLLGSRDRVAVLAPYYFRNPLIR